MTRLFVPNVAGITQPGAVIGYTKSGKPIHLIAGGAPSNIDEWIPIEYDSEVVQRVQWESAIERYAARIPMRSKTKSIARSAGMSVTTGSTYVDDTSANDEVVLTARPFHGRFKVDEEDLADAESRMNVLGAKGLDWAISYADAFDNACLATTGAENEAAGRPFTSVYQTLRTTDSDVSYTADANYHTWDDDVIKILGTPDGTSLYEKLNETFKRVETGKFWSQADSLVIAAPGWRSALRLAMDGNGAPIFGESAGIDSSGRPFDTLFNTRIAWSRGAKLSSAHTPSPTGADLLFFVNARYLKRGDRSGPETLTDYARAQDDTDDMAVKFRARRGFRLTMPQAAAVLERVSDA